MARGRARRCRTPTGDRRDRHSRHCDRDRALLDVRLRRPVGVHPERQRTAILNGAVDAAGGQASGDPRFHSVEPVRHYSKKSAGHLPPTLLELQKLAARALSAPPPSDAVTPLPRNLNRRLDPSTWEEIVAKYKAGATTPQLCAEYALSKGGLLNHLRDRGVRLCRQPLSPEQAEEASRLYGYGFSIAAIARYLDTSYTTVRQTFERLGI